MGQVRRSVHKGMQEIGYKEKREDFMNLRKEGVREEKGKRTRGEKDIKCIKQKGARIKIRT